MERVAGAVSPPCASEAVPVMMHKVAKHAAIAALALLDISLTFRFPFMILPVSDPAARSQRAETGRRMCDGSGDEWAGQGRLLREKSA